MMNKLSTQLPVIKLVGITARTNNAQLFESDPATNVVAKTVQHYFQNNVADKIASRKNPGTTFCVYTDYESDEKGDFTYFIGEEVTSFEKLDDGYHQITIPAQSYSKFTNPPGPMPNVCIDMWKSIWNMDQHGLGGKRTFIADFEIYDHRSADHQNAILDIYIGVT